jgi:endonuclease/exonuclease/phosphatase family metal-dependent hydrolase
MTQRFTPLLLVFFAIVSPFARAQDASPLKVMSFNIRYGTARDGEDHWDKRKEFLVDVVKTFDPDILGTQEVLEFQANYLAENLKDHNMLGVGRDDGKKKGEYTAVYYRADRFEVVDSGHFWLSEKTDVPGSVSWDSSLTRMATWLKFKDKKAGGREFMFLNTHWDHRGKQARVESGKLMRKWADEKAKGRPLVITGDFNTDAGSPPYESLMGVGDDRLIDSYRQTHPEKKADEGTFHGFKGTRDAERIDWILCSKHFTPAAAEIVHAEKNGRYPSDHFPITATIKWNP